MSKVRIELTIEQATALVCALDAYSRLCIGQLDVVTRLVGDGTIPMQAPQSGERFCAQAETIEEIGLYFDKAKEKLGYPRNGINGIGHRHVHVTGHRAWEIRKVVDRVISLHRDPNPEFRGVNYDGLIVRYTDDPAPQAEVV